MPAERTAVCAITFARVVRSSPCRMIFSGHVAALAFEAIRQTNPAVDTFVIFGAP